MTAGLARVRQRLAAVPAKLEFPRAGLTAGEAGLDGRLRRSVFVVGNHRSRMLFLMQLGYPDLWVGRTQRYIAHRCHRVLVEDVRGNADLLEQVAHQVCVGEIGGGVDAFHATIIARDGENEKGRTTFIARPSDIA